jgi:hypothetical protein
MKIRPVRAKLFHAGGRIDMTKLIVDFSNFAKAHKLISKTQQIDIPVGSTSLETTISFPYSRWAE